MRGRRNLVEIVLAVFGASFVVTFTLSALNLRVGMLVRVVLISLLIAAIFSLMDRGKRPRRHSGDKPQAYYSDRR